MSVDPIVLLTPVSDDKPCGETLDSLAAYQDFRVLATSSQRVDWARYFERALSLAQASRDLRAWVWLTRAAVASEGLGGLSVGLQLIAEGLARYWDILPPQHADEGDPRERFMSRLSTLTLLGVTNFTCNADQLRASGHALTDLRFDLDLMVAKAPSNEVTRQALGDAQAAISKICSLFLDRFGSNRDPQLGFELVNEKLASLKHKTETGGETGKASDPAVASPDVVGNKPFIQIRSRDDVIRAFNVMLDYYSGNEPSSPVPLLIHRAKRLVPLSFLEAIRELAPTGLKELQAVAGTVDEKK